MVGHGVTPDAAGTRAVAVLTEAPLQGLILAREKGLLLAWDEGQQLYLIDVQGRHRAVSRGRERILFGSISDDGFLIAIVVEGSRLLLGRDLSVTTERQLAPDPSAPAIDPHGRYVAVASQMGITQLISRFGRVCGRFETRQPLAHLCFIPALPLLLGAATYGTLAGVELNASGTAGRLDPEVLWQESLMSNVGQLASSGEGGVVLASCFTHGIHASTSKAKTRARITWEERRPTRSRISQAG